MPVEHLPPDASAEKVAAVLERDGVVVVDEVARDDQLDAVQAELEPYLDATEPGPDSFSGYNTRRTGGLVARSPASHALITHPLVLGTVGKVLHHSPNFQLHLTQVIAIGPGQPTQYIHRDQWAFNHFPFPKGFEVTCNTIWAMTDFTAANGATRVIPGSNAFDDGLHFPDPDTETEPAEMERGSVLLYTGSLYHGGGPNRTETVRSGINITYTVGWLRQEENQYLSVPLDVARDLPVDLLRLIGYARGAYALGYVDDLRDPIEVVRPDLASPRVQQ